MIVIGADACSARFAVGLSAAVSAGGAAVSRVSAAGFAVMIYCTFYCWQRLTGRVGKRKNGRMTVIFFK